MFSDFHNENYDDNINLAVKFYSEGKVAQDQGDYYKAIKLFRSSLSLNNNYLEPIFALAQVFYELGEYEEALSYATRSSTLSRDFLTKILEANVLIELKSFSDAHKLLKTILVHEPNNLQAILAIARLERESGNYLRSNDYFKRALEVSAVNVDAMLGLVEIYQLIGDEESAAEYIEMALLTDPNNVQVLYKAALVSNNISEAIGHYEKAVLLKPTFVEVQYLLAEAYVRDRKFLSAANTLEGILTVNRNDFWSHFLLGFLREKEGKTSEAIEYYQKSLRLAPEEELVRIVLENLVLEKTDLQDRIRNELSKYHLERGFQFQERSMLTDSHSSFRRAVLLNPRNVHSRVALAGYFLKSGFPLRYLDQMQVIKDLGKEHSDVEETVESLRITNQSSISNSWGINQFNISRIGTCIAVYSGDSKVRSQYLNIENALSEYLIDLLHQNPKIEIMDDYSTAGCDETKQAGAVRPYRRTGVRTIENAFYRSRIGGAVYFFVINYFDDGTVFEAKVSAYLASTGAVLVESNVTGKGNDRISEVLNRIAEVMFELVPQRFRIIDRNFNYAVIDAGKMHQIESGQRFSVVKPEAVSYSREGFNLEYDKDDIIGEFTATIIDESLTEGTLESSGVVDLISVGDEVIMQVIEPESNGS